MLAARALAFVLLTSSGCAVAEPDQLPPSSAAPATQMQRTAAAEPAEPRTVESRTIESRTVEPRTVESQETAPEPAPSEPASAYDRKLWPHWIDVDRDCQDARTEVLIAESYEPITFEDDRRCEVASGRWQCPYTGNIVAEAHLLDVDHLVPLANAHRSGASRWSEAQRRRYANDLEHPEHLIAVEYTANRSKSDKGPEDWLPPLEDARCGYVRDWVTVKTRWQLGMSEAESIAVAEALEICASGAVPPLPQARPREATRDEKAAEREAEPAAGDASKCCRTCKKGKACGDSCIPATKTCSKPPGCACDG